jgi:hypothetical protein
MNFFCTLLLLFALGSIADEIHKLNSTAQVACIGRAP